MKRINLAFAACGLASAFAFSGQALAQTVVGDTSVPCAEDRACMNRLHPEVPMIAEADQGEPITFVTRDAFDLTLDPDEFSVAKNRPREALELPMLSLGRCIFAEPRPEM